MTELFRTMLPTIRRAVKAAKAGAMLLWLFVALLPDLASSTKRMHNIYWNTTNPMFRIDNTDNVIDVNTGNLPWEYDQVRCDVISCVSFELKLYLSLKRPNLGNGKYCICRDI